MHALVLHDVGDLRYEMVPVPALADGDALVRVAAAGVCGSDVPRIYAHGAYHFPLIPGHEIAGIVEAVRGQGPRRPGERVTIKPLIPCGTCAYCQVGAFAQCVKYDYVGSRSHGGFAEYVRVPQRNLLPLPDGVSLMEAALTEPAAVALHALRQGGVEPGDTVAVLGTGPIGMLLAQWARLCGAGEVLLFDLDPQRLEMARELGLGKTYDSRHGDAVGWAREMTGGRGVDLAIEAAGAAATVREAILMTRPLGRMVIMGNPSGDVTLSQDVVSQILRKQLTIRGTWNSWFAALLVDEWQVVVDMVAAGRLDVRSLITHRVTLAEGAQALEMMREGSAFYNKVVLTNDL
jgi:L-iditol 2-dehydrogenase